MKNNFYLVSAFLFAALFWILESVVHSKVFDEAEFSLIPHESDDLWMRSIIVLMIISYGVFVQSKKNTMLRLELEKKEIYSEMIKANNHILNTFLQKMYIFKLEADDSDDFDKDLLVLYNTTIEETRVAIKKLGGLDTPSKAGIEAKYRP